MEKDDLDSLLQVMENPVRRRIIRRLSQEPCYALQLSKELGLGQPLVAKHLGVMEGAGLVSSVAEISPNGPKRKRYSLARGVSITMDVGPNLFIEKGTTIEAKPPRQKATKSSMDLRERVRLAAGETDDAKRLSVLSEVLGDVDRKIEGLEQERVELLAVRNQAMHDAAEVATRFAELDTRRVLFHILDAHDREVERISETLNLREFSVRSILDELKGYFE
jgi:predicted transcriptional regulator